jgi:hypothetical protein
MFITAFTSDRWRYTGKNWLVTGEETKSVGITGDRWIMGCGFLGLTLILQLVIGRMQSNPGVLSEE